MIDKLKNIAQNKPKMQKLLDLLLRIVVGVESGKLECNFSQGGVTSATFTKKEV